MTFSQRVGITPVKTELEKEGMSDELRNGLWSLVRIHIIDSYDNNYDIYLTDPTALHKFYKDLWINFLKKPVDNVPNGRGGTVNHNGATEILRDWYYNAAWFEALDFIEFLSSRTEFIAYMANQVLRREFSAYRFIDGVLVQINSEEEVIELESATRNLDPTSPARDHLRQAMALFSDRKSPDYPNSIKESVSSVESVVRSLLGDEKVTLGAGLRKLEKEQSLPPTLKKAFSTLYGYTSDSGGIRHAMSDGDTPPGVEEARFMLVTCSAFVNYLITKLV